MSEHSYLFVDGAYLRDLYEKKMQAFFGQKCNFDIAAITRSMSAQRAFYYDCLHDVQKLGEAPADFQQRLDEQQARFAAIQSVPGVHLRLGSLTGKPNRMRQKKVDV